MLTVDLITGSRLHFGLICGSNATGWIFGGVGLMLRTPGWHLRLSRNDARNDAVRSNDLVTSVHPIEDSLTAKILETLQALRTCHPQTGSFCVQILQQVPRHAGFGSGTQLALALAAAVQTLLGPHAHQHPDEAARFLHRAQRSSIGTKGFERGGFLIDFGKQSDPDSATRFERIETPESWRFVTVRPVDQSGLCGESERQYFDRGVTMPPGLVVSMSELIQHQLRPSLTEANFPQFANALGQYGQLAGRFYSSEQGGIFTIPEMSELSETLAFQGYPGLAQSSWGPVVCIPASSSEAARHVTNIVSEFASKRSLNWVIEINEPLNQGALIRMPDWSPNGLHWA